MRKIVNEVNYKMQMAKMRMVNAVRTEGFGGIAKRKLSAFWVEEDGMGTVEIILIIVVLIGLVLIFKNQMTTIVNNLFKKINAQTSQF